MMLRKALSVFSLLSSSKFINAQGQTRRNQLLNTNDPNFDAFDTVDEGLEDEVLGKYESLNNEEYVMDELFRQHRRIRGGNGIKIVPRRIVPSPPGDSGSSPPPPPPIPSPTHKPTEPPVKSLTNSPKTERADDKKCRIFLSSATYDGDLGGLEGADYKCNKLARKAGLVSSGQKVFKAVIFSDRENDPGTCGKSVSSLYKCILNFLFPARCQTTIQSLSFLIAPVDIFLLIRWEMPIQGRKLPTTGKTSFIRKLGSRMPSTISKMAKSVKELKMCGPELKIQRRSCMQVMRTATRIGLP